LKPNLILLSGDVESVAPILVSGQAVTAGGDSHDVWLANEQNEAIAYVLPE
jgi:hypothetical protein